MIKRGLQNKCLNKYERLPKEIFYLFTSTTVLSSVFFFLQSFHQKSHLEFTINNSNKKEDQVLLTSIFKAPASIDFRDSNCVNTNNAHLRHFPIEAMKCLLNIFRKMCCFTTLYVALELCKLLYPYDQRQTLHVAVAIVLK